LNAGAAAQTKPTATAVLSVALRVDHPEGPAMSDASTLKAAQYLRMSTEHQRYSLRNQAEAIAAYAVAHGYDITRTYFDPGKSGLTLKHRKGLQALLAAALSPTRDFDAILVLDVSRWGRFQDMDQSAHYEFLCREAGIKLIYCEEPFLNDGTAMSSIVKQIKRIMAAEFSRELSDKVHFAHRTHAALGHHQGAPRPYGFRRVEVDAAGNPRAVLDLYHWKSVATNHVVLVPGPPEELNVIRRIFRRYAEQGRTPKAIAAELNAASIPSNGEGLWTHRRISHVLKNELVIGDYVYAKTRMHLRGRKRRTSPDTWVRVRVFDPIVPPRLFRLAEQRRSAQRRVLIDDEALLDGLRRLLRERGSLSVRLIETCPYLPRAQTLRTHFGSLAAAYAKIGYAQVENFRNGLTNDEMLALLRRAYARHGYLSSSVIAADETLPHFATYQYRFGTLTRAYELAGLPPNVSEISRQAHRTGPSKLSDEALLAGLRRLWDRDGYVSKRTLDADRRLPGHTSYQQRFGSWLKAVERAGLPADLHTICSAAAKRRLKVGAKTRRSGGKRTANAAPVRQR
jgi:DNA invertase Pin-like site-specific DNA recombinase